MTSEFPKSDIMLHDSVKDRSAPLNYGAMGGRLIDKGHPKSTILHNSIGDFFEKSLYIAL